MKAIDGTITLLSFLWIPKAKFYYFYSAPGDSLVIKVKANKELDGVYLGRFNERPLLSEVYTKEVVWSAKSDTQTLWFIMFLQTGFFEKNEVSFEVWRFNNDSSLKNFNTRVIFERRKVFYVDTLWDSVPKLYKTWRVLIPPLSSSLYGALFDGELSFESDGENFVLWVAERSYDDSLRFLFGESFLERRRCISAVFGKVLNAFIVHHVSLDTLKFVRVSLNSCEKLYIPEGKYLLILENLSTDRVDLVVRLLKVKLIPKEIKRYKYVSFPRREGD
ncbi:MAG: hypothetical protein ACO2OT_04255 [Candidatus Caldipriscus sp.]